MQQGEDSGRTAGTDTAGEGPDVLLDVPQLQVEEIDLEVDDLRARISLRTEVLDLLRLHVGADVTLGRVRLNIKGVDAQAQLRVRLDNVAEIVERVLDTVDRHPEILTHLTRDAGQALEDVGGCAGETVRDVGGGAREAVREVGGGAGGATSRLGRVAGRVTGATGLLAGLRGRAADASARLSRALDDRPAAAAGAGGAPGRAGEPP